MLAVGFLVLPVVLVCGMLALGAVISASLPPSPTSAASAVKEPVEAEDQEPVNDEAGARSKYRGKQQVSGYTRKDGKVVQPYQRRGR